MSASYVPGGTNVTTLIMSQQLAEDFIDDTQWTLRLANFDQTISTVETVGSTAIITSVDGGADAGADVVSYTDTAGDLRNRFGQLPAVSFANFAIT